MTGHKFQSQKAPGMKCSDLNPENWENACPSSIDGSIIKIYRLKPGMEYYADRRN